ncbi:MAG: hypothetical protein R2939_11155 [Kofleriaceae bacterium]
MQIRGSASRCGSRAGAWWPAIAALGALASCGGGGGDPPDARALSFDTVLDEAPAAATNGATARFAFRAVGVDGFDTAFTCRVDDDVIDDCTSPFEVDVADGAHVFSVAGVVVVDGAPVQVDDTPAIATWTLDRVAPDTTLFIGPGAFDNSASPRIFFGADEPGVTYQCTLDGGPPMACTSPWLLGPLADGEHTVTIAAVDAAGNPDPTPLIITWTVDTSLPDTIIDAGPAPLVGTAAQQVAFSATAGAGATFACSLDGAAATACTSPFVPPALPSGLHVFQVAVTSAAGTSDPSPATWIWEIDATPPTVAFDAAPAASSYERLPSIAFSGADVHGPLTFECALDGPTFAACASPLVPAQLAFGPHDLTVRATDAVGNQATVSHSWTVASVCAVDNGGCGAIAAGTCSQPANGAVCTCNPGYVAPDVACVPLWALALDGKASNAAPSTYFGGGVALSADGQWLAVAATHDNSGSGGVDGDQSDVSAPDSGAVYVFMRDGTGWSQQAYLKARFPTAGAAFGRAVSISADGSLIAVGADQENSNATGINGDDTNTLANSAGAAYVFVRAGLTWSQEAYIKASNTDASDQFGRKLALSGDGTRLAVAAPYEDSPATGIDGNQALNTAGFAGAVYVFVRDAGTWTQEAYVKASNTGNTDQFGASVAMSGDGSRMIVGAPGEGSAATGVGGDQASNAAGFSGAAYVFTRAGTVWTQEAYLKASNTEASDQLGVAAAMSAAGDRVVLGATGEDSDATGVDGDQASNAAADSGAAYVFVRSGTSWSQEAYVKPSNTEAGDYFGFSIAMSADGTRVAGGAIYESSSAEGYGGDQNNNGRPYTGAAYVLGRTGANWAQEAYLKGIFHGGTGANFGISVSLAGDGRTVAAGAHSDDGGGLVDSGAAYVFDRAQ